MVKKKSRHPQTSTTPARSEVLPQEEPPDPMERSPLKDSVHPERLTLHEEMRASVLASGGERHVTTDAQAEIPDPNATRKGKARAASPQQYTTRETFLSPKLTRTVADRSDYVFPSTEEEIPQTRKPSSVLARTPEGWTSSDDHNDPNGARKLHRKYIPSQANENPEGLLPAMLFDNSFWQQRGIPVAEPTSQMPVVQQASSSNKDKNMPPSNQLEEDANISSAYENIFNPRRHDGETSDEYRARKTASQCIKRENTPPAEKEENRLFSPTRLTESQVLQIRIAELKSRVEETAEARRKYDAKLGRRWEAEKTARDELKAVKNKLAEVTSKPATAVNSVYSPPQEGYEIPRANEEYIKSEYSQAHYEAWKTAEAILDRYRELDLKKYGRSHIPPPVNRNGYEETQRECLPSDQDNQANNNSNSGRRPQKPPSPPSSDDNGDDGSNKGGGGPGRSPPRRPDNNQDDSSDSDDSDNGDGHRPSRTPSQPPRTILRSTNEHQRSALRKSKSRSMSLGPLDPLWAEDEHEMIYENVVVQKIRDTIIDCVGNEAEYDVTGMKHIKPVPPEKYGGDDNIEGFEDWLAGVLRWLRVSGVTGQSKEQLRVDLCGTTLKGIAADWFHQEVESFDRKIRHWTFVDLIVAMYARFIHEVTAQNATDKFYNAKYSK